MASTIAASGSCIQVRSADGVAEILLDRPHVHNAMNRAMVDELAAACAALDQDNAIRVILVSGNGKSFCSGIDVKEALPQGLAELYLSGVGDREAIYRVRKPVIAAVSGAAFGAGLELALACDIIVCDATARFGAPEVSRGSMPGAGGTQRLARLVGRMRATELCLTGRVVLAEEAVQLGLAIGAEPGLNAHDTAARMAMQIAKAKPHIAVLIKQSCRMHDEVALPAGLSFERLANSASRAADGI